MLGHKSREFKQHLAISLEALVPQDNFYRQVDQCIDLSFVRDLAEEFYSSFGRPSIELRRAPQGGCYSRPSQTPLPFTAFRVGGAARWEGGVVARIVTFVG